ncbi:MAG: AAA family ATPase [Rhodobacterales bacterium]|nr:AAA family ATPase [Rhodobacterales bacterium]
MSRLTPEDIILGRRVIVCAGSGGVGKTTTATAIALAAARSGRRVLALTVDPSKRLAETLGVDRNLPRPVPVPAETLKKAGITDPSLLEAWMLDPGVVADAFVHRFAESPELAARLTKNRIYKQVSRMIAGMQEYTAMEALYGFLREERYDLIVLDTPPSRNALDFLYGPSRLSNFLDGRIFQLFLPGEKRGLFRRATSRLVNGVNAAVFGRETYEELQEFFTSFADIFKRMTKNASAGLQALRDPDDVAFVLVTSPATEAMTDALFFRRKCIELELPFAGFVLNRSQAGDDDRTVPPDELFGSQPSAVEQSALGKLQQLALFEQAAVVRDQERLTHLAENSGDDAFALALPQLPGGAEKMEALVHLGQVLMRSHSQ